MKGHHLILFKILIFSILAQISIPSIGHCQSYLSHLSPSSQFEDGEQGKWVVPQQVMPLLNYTYGDEGIEALINLLNSSRAERIIHEPLRKRGLRIVLSPFYSPSGAHYLRIDIFPVWETLVEAISQAQADLGRDVGEVTSMDESSLGRISILVAKKEGYAIPMIWEIQPSASWRKLNEDDQTDSRVEQNWRLDVSNALARFLINSGFANVFARSAKSMQRHPKYRGGSDPTGRGIKDNINPRDIKENYGRTFANRSVWSSANVVEYSLFLSVLKSEGFKRREFELHQYRKHDLTLFLKGIAEYRFQEITTRKGKKLLVVFRSEKTGEDFAFDYNLLVKRLENTNLPVHLNGADMITRYLRFNLRIPVFNGGGHKKLKKRDIELVPVLQLAA